jgi:glycosyltransferase involved in cell wall biosynthesis
MLVDITVPAYGDGELLREAVRSVMDQRDDHWRLTVIDDRASTSDTRALCDWLGSQCGDRVRVIENPQRLGINRNFQRCFDESSADLVQVLGADDRLLPDFVGRVRDAAIDHPEATWFHTGATVIDGAGRTSAPLADRVKRAVSIRVPSDRTVGGEELATSLLRGNWMYFPSVVFRREIVAVHGFRPGYDIVLDLDLYLRLLVAGEQCLLFAHPGIEYRRHAESVSSEGADDGSRFAEEIRYFAEVEADMRDRGWPRAERAARLHLTSRLHSMVRAAGLARSGRWNSARRFAGHAFMSTARSRAFAEEGRV